MSKSPAPYLPLHNIPANGVLLSLAIAFGFVFAIILVVIAVALLSAGGASAAEPTTNSLDKIVSLYQTSAKSWETTLANYAKTLFWLLATIELIFAGIRLTVKGADFSEWASELVMQILFIGFFAALLTNSSAWATAIVNSFRQAANAAVQASGGQSMMAPSDIFSIGLNMANKVLDHTSIWTPGASVGLLIFALVLVVCFALIAAFLVLALVESYIVISAGVLFMGFGGSKFTKDFAVRVIVYALSVGAKLFVMQLLIGLGQQIFNQLVANFETNTSDLLVAVGSAIVMLALVKIIPDMVQGLLNGTSIGGHGVLSGMAWGAAAGTATAAGGAVMMGISASTLASDQVAARGGGNTAWRTVSNIAAAAVETVGNRISGRAHFGTFMGQMSEAMDASREDLHRSGGGQSGGGQGGGGQSGGGQSGGGQSGGGQSGGGQGGGGQGGRGGQRP